MVFMHCGRDHTAKDMYEWYCTQEIIATKRIHGSASEARTVATRQRHAVTGTYGFDKGKESASASGDTQHEVWKRLRWQRTLVRKALASVNATTATTN